jgi:hypothetical protein
MAQESKSIEQYLDEMLFWGRSRLPTGPQLLVLEHLAKEGEPRLYMRGYENGYLRAGVSNSASETGFEVRCDVEPFVNRWYGKRFEWWVERDEVLSAGKDGEHSVYKISRTGRAVIEWAHSQGRYGAMTPSSPQALRNMRERAGEEKDDDE